MSIKTISLAVLGTLVFSGVCYFLARPEPSSVISKAFAGETSDVNVYGFYMGMSKEEFMKQAAALKADPNNFFVKWIAIPSEDGKSLAALGLVFPTDRFTDVAKEIVKHNGGKMNCEKSEDGNIFCAITDSHGNTLNLVARVFRDQAGHTFGALALTDKEHSDPKNPKTAPESEKHESGSLHKDSGVDCKKPQYEQDGHCVTDL